MCVWNLSERYFFSGMSYSDHSIRVSKSTKMWKRLYFSQKPGIKWCKKRCFPLYVTQKGVYFFSFGTTKLCCFFRFTYAYPRKNESPPSPPGPLECSDWNVVNQSNCTQLDGVLRTWKFDDATSGLWWPQIFGLIPPIPNKLVQV